MPSPETTPSATDLGGYYWVRHKGIDGAQPQIMRESLTSGGEKIWLDFNDWWARDSVEVLSPEVVFEGAITEPPKPSPRPL